MKVFYVPQMFLSLSPSTPPSHSKAIRFFNEVQKRNIEIERTAFDPLDWIEWEKVHDKVYLNEIRACAPKVIEEAGLIASTELVDTLPWCGASLIQACMNAIDSGCTLSPTSGFHHAHYASPGVFCLLNALPLAALKVLDAAHINSVLILDCDYHVGNGTDDILSRLNDSRIIHATLGRKYRHPDQAEDYLVRIRQIARSISESQYDFVIYQAGMDVLIGDPAGGGILTAKQTKVRDTIIFEACRDSETPITWNFAGGYKPFSSDSDPTVEGHLASLDIALTLYS